MRGGKGPERGGGGRVVMCIRALQVDFQSVFNMRKSAGHLFRAPCGLLIA